MLTYFIAMNPDLLVRSPKPVEPPDYYAPREGDSPGMAAWLEHCGARKAAGPNPSSLPSIEVELVIPGEEVPGEEVPGEEVDPSKSEPSA